MRSEIINLGVLALIVFLIANSFTAHGEQQLNWSSVQTISQISNLTIPSNNTYVGALKLYDIDVSKISAINISASTYTMNISIIRNSYIFGLITPTTIITEFKDKILLTTQSKSFTVLFPKTNDILMLPQFTLGYTTNRNGEVINIAIYNDQAYWKSSESNWTGSSSRMQPLINNPYNASTLMRAMPSKVVVIKVTGTDAVNVDYVLGSSSQLGDISSNFADALLDADSAGWMVWALSKIPWIGIYLAATVTFLSTLFSTIFAILVFLVLDLDILVLMVLSFSMMHGIIVMASGGTPFDGVNHPVRDILFVFERMYKVLVMLFTLIWKIVQAIATIIP